MPQPAFLKLCFSFRKRIKIMTGFGKKKRDIAIALSQRKSSKKQQQQQREMEDQCFKRLKAEIGMNMITKKRCSSNVAAKKGRRSSLLEVGANVERLEEEVAEKRAETRILRLQLMEGETKVEASLEKLSQLRTVNSLLFLENLRDQGLVNHLTRRILG